MSRLSQWIESGWYGKGPRPWPLLPLAWLTAAVARRRLRRFRAAAEAPPVPVVVVGNVTVGGTGKTPLVVTLCEFFQRNGLRVAVISRGYGVRHATVPFTVDADGDAATCGDEPLLIAQRTGAPVVIDPRRRRALQYAIDTHKPDVVISDDGLQHYDLPRTVDIAVVDGQRGLGNGYCLPVGPLREPAERLALCDWVIINGDEHSSSVDGVIMHLDISDPVNLRSGEAMALEDFAVRFPVIHAVAGIGNPGRFFSALEGQGFRVVPHPFPDHHAYAISDFDAFADGVILMTEKDAVKCRELPLPHAWYLPVAARLPTVLTNDLLEKVRRKQ
ncbi:MAG: tetraacyldisaccharide 4'-kinase [Alcanivoracaceae bacterium]|nr:tetraacyldisaccharide 4'-kinase [Alcanivoracaceae bacterium]